MKTQSLESIIGISQEEQIKKDLAVIKSSKNPELAVPTERLLSLAMAEKEKCRLSVTPPATAVEITSRKPSNYLEADARRHEEELTRDLPPDY